MGKLGTHTPYRLESTSPDFTRRSPPSHIPLLAVIPGGCRMGLLIAADEDGERIPIYKGQAPALILREGGTAKVPPFTPPLHPPLDIPE